MKKTLLTLSAVVFSMALQAQVIFNVLAPQNFQGNYEMNFPTNWVAMPDLTNPANAVTGVLAYVNDGSANPTLGCLALQNAADIQGKIAVINRGECQFGTKALNANVAGAIAVVIVNNVPGSPVGMAAGDVGDQVNIPVVMISFEAGQLLQSEIEQGNVEVFIGNKLGLFAHDLGFFAEDIYLPNGNSIPALVAQNGGEFSYTPAAWVHNYGQQGTQAGRLDVTITHNNVTVYQHHVTGINIASGQSIYVSTPAFAPAEFTPGLYEISLNVSFDDQLSTQGYVTALDNTFNAGQGYTTQTNVSTTSTGSGQGLTVDIVATNMNTVSALDASSLVSGSDYENATGVATSSNGSGSGLTVDIVTLNGGVTEVAINAAGQGYAVGDLITISGGNADATIEVAEVNAGGEIVAITINQKGTGYEEGDVVTIDGGDASIEITAVASEDEQYDGDNVYEINLMISADNVFTRSSINPDGTMNAGPGYRVQGGDAFSACVAYTHPQAGRMALDGMYFGATGAADTEIGGELLGLTVWRMNSTFTSINDPNYAVDVTLVANADFDIPIGAENGDIFFSQVKTGDGDFLILEDNQRYVFCVGTDNPDVFILFDGGGLDNRRQYEGVNGNAQPDYYIFTTGLGRFTDFFGLPAIGVKFFDKNMVSTEENSFVDVTPYPNPTTEFLNIPLNNLNGAAQLSVFDASGRMISTENVNVENNVLKVDVQNFATGVYTFTMAFENGKNSSFKVMVNK